MPDKNEKKIAAIVMAVLVALYLLGIVGGIAALAGLLGPLEGRAAFPLLLTYILVGGAVRPGPASAGDRQRGKKKMPKSTDAGIAVRQAKRRKMPCLL